MRLSVIETRVKSDKVRKVNLSSNDRKERGLLTNTCTDSESGDFY